MFYVVGIVTENFHSYWLTGFHYTADTFDAGACLLYQRTSCTSMKAQIYQVSSLAERPRVY